MRAKRAGDQARARAEEVAAQFDETRRKSKKIASDELNEALERVRSSPRNSGGEGILEARERLKASDRETLMDIRRVMDKKRRGEYVSSEELDWAFRMMDTLI